MEIEKGIVCPICGAEIEWDDCYDNDIYNNEYINHCAGTCVKCKENIEYDIIYPLGEPTKIIIDHYKI